MGNSNTKEKKGSAKVGIVDDPDTKTKEKADEVAEFQITPEKSTLEQENYCPVKEKSQPIVITPARPVIVADTQQESPLVRSDSVASAVAIKEVTPPPPQNLKPLKQLKPLGWSIEDDNSAKMDAAEKEHMLQNKRIELDRKRLQRKMEKQRQKEEKELAKKKNNEENATKEEKVAQQEQKTTQQLLEEEESSCMESLKQMCSPTISYNLTSEQWAHRKEGIGQIQQFVEDSSSNIKQLSEDVIIHQFSAILIVLRKYFQDRVAPVYFAAYDCFRCLLNVYGKYIFDSKEVTYALQSIIPPLIVSMGGESTGTNRRTQREACRCILRVARLAEIDGLGLIVQLLKVDTIPLRPRLALLKILMQEFSLDDENCRGCRLTLKLVFDMSEPSLNHSDDKVRRAGVEAIVLAYSMVGSNVRQYISNVKPAMLKVLEEKFSEIDHKRNGGPGKAGVLSPAKVDDTLAQIQRDKQKKRKKGGENIKGLLNPVVLTKTNSGRGDEFMNQLQNTSSSGSFLDQAAAKGKNKAKDKDNAPYLSSTLGSNSSLGSRLNNSQKPERDSPPSPRNREEVSENEHIHREHSGVSRTLFTELSDGSYGHGGNGSFSSGFGKSGRSDVNSRFHIRD